MLSSAVSCGAAAAPATAASEFPGLAPERAVADYVLANVLVLLAVWNYLV